MMCQMTLLSLGFAERIISNAVAHKHTQTACLDEHSDELSSPATPMRSRLLNSDKLV